MEIKYEDIAGYYVDQKLYCMECVEKEKIEIEDPESILSNDDVEKDEALFFCDQCKKKI